MPLNLVKLCVGAASVEDLANWQQARVADLRRSNPRAHIFHTTFQTPKRVAELLDGGSLYWVIKGVIQVRQRLVGIGEGVKDNGAPCCILELDDALVPVRPTPRRAFQGWRYLAEDEAPSDLGSGDARGLETLPDEMRRELAALCLI